jgi:hypothetical protein
VASVAVWDAAKSSRSKRDGKPRRRGSDAVVLSRRCAVPAVVARDVVVPLPAGGWAGVCVDGLALREEAARESEAEERRVVRRVGEERQRSMNDTFRTDDGYTLYRVEGKWVDNQDPERVDGTWDADEEGYPLDDTNGERLEGEFVV